MPYIKEDRRAAFAALEDEINNSPSIENSGELNYLMTLLAKRYMEIHGKRYQTMNDITGAFVNASQEFYRRVAAPYEDQKITENGDVY